MVCPTAASVSKGGRELLFREKKMSTIEGVDNEAVREEKPCCVGAVILAAGASNRLGTPKQLLQFRGQSLLRHVAETALASACRSVVVVLGAHAEKLRPQLVDLQAQVVTNDDWQEGMSSSVRAGLESLTASAESEICAAVLMLCDQPLISAQVINRLVEAHRATAAAPVVASRYGGGFGVPALFGRRLFPELMKLKGAAGAKQVIKAHAHETRGLFVPEGIVDIDTRTDYERLCRSIERDPDLVGNEEPRR